MGLGLRLIGIVQVLAVLTADLDRVAKTLGRDHRRLRIRPLQQRIRRRRRAVDQMRDIGKPNAGLLHCLKHAEVRRSVVVRTFASLCSWGLAIPAKKVRKCPSDIDAYAPHIKIPCWMANLRLHSTMAFVSHASPSGGGPVAAGRNGPCSGGRRHRVSRSSAAPSGGRSGRSPWPTASRPWPRRAPSSRSLGRGGQRRGGGGRRRTASTGFSASSTTMSALQPTAIP